MYLIKQKNGQWEHEGSFVAVRELNEESGYELWRDGHYCGKISIVDGKVQLVIGLRGTPVIFERKVFEDAYAKDMDFIQFLQLSPNLVWLDILNEEGESIFTYGSQEESSEVDFDYLPSNLSIFVPKGIGFDFGCKY